MSSFLEEECQLQMLEEPLVIHCASFNCGSRDLDDFFQKEAIKYNMELLGKTYLFTLKSDESKVVCAFTLANDSIKTPLLSSNAKRRINKKISRSKQMKSYPALLIGRLGVHQEYKKQGIGTEVMNFIKDWFFDVHNKTGCRFIVVDAYNTTEAISYYNKNGFDPVYKSEAEEKSAYNLRKDEPLKTRLLHFDLLTLKVN